MMRGLLIPSIAAALATVCAAAHGACPNPVSTQIEIEGSSICVIIDDAALSKQQPMLRTWIDRSAHIVADYYGRFPAPLLILKLGGMDGSGVGGVRTTNDAGLLIQARQARDS